MDGLGWVRLRCVAFVLMDLEDPMLPLWHTGDYFRTWATVGDHRARRTDLLFLSILVLVLNFGEGVGH